MFRPAFLLALAAMPLAPVAAQAQAADPAARVAAYNDQVVAIMKARLPLAQRTDRFEAAVRAYYDMPAITALVIGPKWAASPAADRQAAIAALTRHSALSLARNFASYGGERFIVDPDVAVRDSSRIVKVTIRTGTSGGDTLLYRMRQSGGEWRIIDVIAQGVSQLAVQRADLARTVATDGVAGVARRLRAIDGGAQR